MSALPLPADPSAADTTAWVEAGLYDPAAPNAADTLGVLTFLTGLGATIERMVEADRQGMLPGLALELGLWRSGERFTLAEAAARAGITVEAAEAVWRATGFPSGLGDSALFGEEDVAAFSLLQASAAMFGEDVIHQLMRVVGSSMARVADAVSSAFVAMVASTIEQSPTFMTDVARADAEAGRMLPALGTVMDVLLRHHVELILRRGVYTMDTISQEGLTLAVGFTDLVGFTSMSQGLSARDLTAALVDFENGASDIVSAHGGRVVKLIGDEVMYVTPDPLAACEIALELAETLEGHATLPQGRTAVALGQVLTRDGDCYGPIVNRAHRLVKLARPGTVLVTEGLRERIGRTAPVHFRQTPVHRLRGFDDHIRVFALRRGAATTAAAG